MPNSINQDSMRNLNLKLTLQYLFNHPDTSRIEIAKQLSLNKSTISSLFNELNTRGYITEMGQGSSTETGGRKPTLIRFNHNYGYTVNFELGHHHLRMMINWLSGEKIKFTSIPVMDMDIYEIVDIMKQSIREINIPSAMNGLMGISIAINGIVSNNTILDSPFIDMKDVDLVKELQEFNVLVVLENEANLAAIASRDFTSKNQIDNLIALNIHNGIGAGIVINGLLYRGEDGEAGEIGRTLYFSNEKTAKTQPIETLYSEDAIISKFGNLKHLSNMDRDHFLEYYRADDKISHQIMDEFIRATAYILFNISRSFSPTVIYLQSRIIGEMPNLLDDIKKQYIDLTNIEIKTHIKLSSMIEDAPLYGGASLITHQVLGLTKYQLNFNN